MSKIKYILKRIRNVQWKQMLNVAKIISQKTKKPQFVILGDMIFCALKYGAGYMDYFEFEFYLLNNSERKTFLTSSINNKIIQQYNNKNFFDVFSDKLKFNNRFNKYLNHEYVDLREINKKEFADFCKSKKSIVGKVLDSCGGKGVEIYDIDNNADTLYEELLAKKQFLVEETIVQNSTMNRLYSGSVNTLRIISFLKDNGEVVILNTVLRIGNGGKVDNFSSGGMYTFVSPKGVILLPAIDEKGNIYTYHPLTNTKIVDFKIPQFDKVLQFVKKIAKVVPEMRYIGWDIAIGENGPVLIEGNEYSGVFQMKPSLSGKKEGLLKKYRLHMDI